VGVEACRFLTKGEVLAIHWEMVRRHGGRLRIWDEGRLDAAVAAPRASFGGVRAHETICDVAAAYWFHISQNHPFESANKRTAGASCLTFLHLNGFRLDCTNADFVSMGYEVANGAVKEAALSEWIASKVIPVTR
jgi:death on curing protein